MNDLPEILELEGLTVETLFYELLLLETQATQETTPAGRRRVTNCARDRRRDR